MMSNDLQWTDRRQFLKSSASMAGALALRPMSTVAADGRPVISKITICRVPGEFRRPVAMNAYDEQVVGKNGSIRLVRAILSDGTVGLGVEGYVPIKEDGLQFLDDRYHNFALDSSAYMFRDGQWLVPDKPGWGVELSPDYEFFAKAGEEIVIT